MGLLKAMFIQSSAARLCRVLLRAAAVLSITFFFCPSAQTQVDYATQVQPIFTRSCEGGFCHIDMDTSGIDLSTYDASRASEGFQYAGRSILPGDAENSPLWLKIAFPDPEFGARMPRLADPLSQQELDLVAAWINEGALESVPASVRGDLDRNGNLSLTDAVIILSFLFLGGDDPFCSPVADINSSGELNITDAIYLLDYLFLGGPAPQPLSPGDAVECSAVNRAPEAEPIGTITAREGSPVSFQVNATDPDNQELTFALESSPPGLELDATTGVVTWTPQFGQEGDHRIEIRISDTGTPPMAVSSNGLIRVLRGNHPPNVAPIGTVYAREGVLLSFPVEAVDAEGDTISFELMGGPEGASVDSETGLFQWLPSPGQAGQHSLSIRVSDDGQPPGHIDAQGLLVCLEADSPINQAPSIPAQTVYRTYSGLPIRFNIGASDPDGHDLDYSAALLPEGASLDASSGLFEWMPAPGQAGPAYIPFTVTDSGLPPLVSEEILVFQICPPSPCAQDDCDPETGCSMNPIPIQEDCCAGPPANRVAEPVADCPGGRVLYLGRNQRGFGRINHCDFLPIALFGQGGANLRLNVEAKCINIEDRVRVRFRLKTAAGTLFDRTRVFDMVERSDGFAHKLGLVFDVSNVGNFFALEGVSAELWTQLTDEDGVVLERTLRLTLTLGNPADLPDPDTEDIPAGEIGCVGCHRPLDQTGVRHGIEDAHPWADLTCTDCHGGDAAAITRQEAHVPPEVGPVFLRNLATDALDLVDEDYLRFINPGDLRVAHRGCGGSSPASNGSNCHQGTVDKLKLSVMATYAGHYTLPRFLAGTQDRNHTHAAVDVTNPDFNPLTAPAGAVGELTALREPDPGLARDSVGACIDVYLPKSCPSCHLNDFGPNNADGNYRSSGCTACHMLYSDDGISVSEDPVITKDFPPHPRRHVLTSKIPTEQCAHCHFQGGRIGLAYRGIREGGFSEDKTPANGVTLGRELHAHGVDYYFSDEDDTNDYDETPPDLHAEAGMGCIDCHVGADVHGDGNLYGSERYQVGIKCEDCHGTVRAEISENEAGHFHNSGNSRLKRLRRDGEGRIKLRLAMNDQELYVPQIYTILQSGINTAMNEAMGVDEKGFSHADSLECYTCHTSWRQTCFGCHVTVDDSRTARNLTTGQDSQGAISVSRDDYSLEFFALGMNQDGKISPLCNSMSVFTTYVDANGQERFRDRVRTSADGRTGFGWNPFHHHTVSRVPQNCDTCHPVKPGAAEENQLRLSETYGFGNGRFLSEDGVGVVRDLSAFLNSQGELIGEFPHPETGPVPENIRQRALSIEVVPPPRQER